LRGLLDTSVYIAGEQGRDLLQELIPDEAAVSVVTLAELELGVQMAGSDAVRAGRLRTLHQVRAQYIALPIDEAVASRFAELVATLRRDGLRAGIQDTWIAATALAQDVPVYTQDRDFDELSVEVVQI
jgi:predicted nucleic acid-binding protein